MISILERESIVSFGCSIFRTGIVMPYKHGFVNHIETSSSFSTVRTQCPPSFFANENASTWLKGAMSLEVARLKNYLQFRAKFIKQVWSMQFLFYALQQKMSRRPANTVQSKLPDEISIACIKNCMLRQNLS